MISVWHVLLAQMLCVHLYGFASNTYHLDCTTASRIPT